jgi:hypothetical protein
MGFRFSEQFSSGRFGAKREPAGLLTQGEERFLEPSGSPDEGKQRNVARALDCDGQRSLMFGAGAGLSARLDLAALGNVAA